MGALGLFEGYGIEVELMLVHASDLSVFPVSDRILAAAGDRGGSGDVVRDETAWSNELVLHVIELKTNGPRASLDGLAAALAADARALNALLEPMGGGLLPTAMHPFMVPLRDARIWPHGNGEIYSMYDRIFGCRTHGFSNLQSMQINLPFRGDAEFGRLHAAIRLVLPILPALAASSPFVEGSATGIFDNRIIAYRRNQRLVPSITGAVIPERAYTRSDYEDKVLRPIGKDIARLDRDGLLEPEWVNSRGAIARFIRDTIEIRVIDSQECASADMAIAATTVAVVRALVEERWAPFAEQAAIHESFLEPVFSAATVAAGNAVVKDAALLRCFGLGAETTSLTDVWTHLIEGLDVQVDGGREPLDVMLRQGCLSKRILGATGAKPKIGRIREVYRELAACLEENRVFTP